MEEYRILGELEYFQGDTPEGMSTVEVYCESCTKTLVVGFTTTQPDSINCPCSAKILLYKCLNCGVGHDREAWDQAFLELFVPYGSTVWDSKYYGPAYLCSTRCLLEAFKNDSFDAKNMTF